MTTLISLGIILLVISVVIMLVGVALNNKPLGVGGGVGAVVFFIIPSILTAIKVDREDKDISRRTTTVIGRVVDVNFKDGAEGMDGCSPRFKLEAFDTSKTKLPSYSFTKQLYSFEIMCVSTSLGVEWMGMSSLMIGDVVRIKFIAPKKVGGKSQVLEFLNLTFWTESRCSVPEVLPQETPPAPAN